MAAEKFLNTADGISRRKSRRNVFIRGEEAHTDSRHTEGKSLRKTEVGLVKLIPGLSSRAGVLRVFERSFSFPG